MLIETLNSLSPDLVVLAGFMRVLPKGVVDAFGSFDCEVTFTPTLKQATEEELAVEQVTERDAAVEQATEEQATERETTEEKQSERKALKD